MAFIGSQIISLPSMLIYLSQTLRILHAVVARTSFQAAPALSGGFLNWYLEPVKNLIVTKVDTGFAQAFANLTTAWCSGWNPLVLRGNTSVLFYLL